MGRFTEVVEARLAEDQALIRRVLTGADHPEAPLIRCQTGEPEFKLPEYFRGSLEAEVAFLGPHAPLLADEPAPLLGASTDAYLEFYCREIPERVPFSHYEGICGGRPWIALELPPWKAPKDLVLSVLKDREAGPETADRSLRLICSLLNATPASTLVVTGAETMKWVWRLFGWPGRPPGATAAHGKVQGEVMLPAMPHRGAPGRTVRVVTSFHWGPEVPFFVRKVPGLAAFSPREAISRARQMITEQLI